jgi:hypothetical protein
MAASEAEYEARSREVATQTKFGWMSCFAVRADAAPAHHGISVRHSPMITPRPGCGCNYGDIAFRSTSNWAGNMTIGEFHSSPCFFMRCLETESVGFNRDDTTITKKNVNAK